jgi:hypothetical protein
MQRKICVWLKVRPSVGRWTYDCIHLTGGADDTDTDVERPLSSEENSIHTRCRRYWHWCGKASEFWRKFNWHEEQAILTVMWKGLWVLKKIQFTRGAGDTNTDVERPLSSEENSTDTRCRWYWQWCGKASEFWRKFNWHEMQVILTVMWKGLWVLKKELQMANDSLYFSAGRPFYSQVPEI